MKRRTLLLGGAAAGGALLLGWGLLPPRSRLGRRELLAGEAGAVALNGWIRIGADGGVQLAMPRAEMGQGVHTALAMLVAEELDFPLERVQLVPAGSAAIYGNVAMFVSQLPFQLRDKEPGRESDLVTAGEWIVAKLARELGISVTGGSSSVADAWEPLRLAAATARAQLVGAASLAWRLPKEEIGIEAGVLSHPSGARGHFGEVAAAAAGTPTGTVSLKPREAWTLIGRPAPRIDLAAKCDGRAVFGLDVRPAGLLHAAVRMCPMLGGQPGRIDNVDAVLRRPGVERLVRLRAWAGATAGVAVVGRTSWHARQAVEALDIEWRAPVAGQRLDSAAILDALEATARAAFAVDGGFAFHSRGDVRAAERLPGARHLDAVYRAPYLAHMALEPINCTVQVEGGRVTVWAPTQVPGIARALAARAAGVAEAAVTVHMTLLGGGFGRRLDADFVAQAVEVAQECGGRPVQLLWSREEDTTHDFYRPAAVAVLKATLGADGLPLALRVVSAGDAVTPRWLERGLPQLAGPIDAPDKTTVEGLFDLPYDIAHARTAHVATRSGVPVGYWRSVGHSHNAFFSEGFIDECAQAARQDPVAYRLALLQDLPRHAAVLKLAAARGGWGRPLADGRARGVALHESFGSIVAQVVEVSLPAGTTVPRVHRVVCAVDCGTVVNPGIVAQQMEGAILFGLGAALHGRIDIEGGVVRQKNYPDQPLPRLADTPAIEVHLLPSKHPPTGVGEPGTPPVAPAVANALFALTGRRLRELPLRA
ncbi:MAG TPA: molybdopterin cofactor-binding domain-containing protein [Methylibium sp.]|nr:molybdopterin cofactor-binding domain-containing protein [Methylibium sp.]